MKKDFVQSMREIETMKPITQEELDAICDGILNLASEEDDEILDDENVMQAIIEHDEYKLISSLEGDKQAIDYFQQHSEGLSEKSKRRLEKMRESIA